MVERYEQLFKELYEKRLFNKQIPDNSYDKVRLIQRKMNQNLTKKHSRTNLSFHVLDSSPFLQQANSQPPKRIIRQVFENNAIKRGRRFSLPHQKYQQISKLHQKPISLTTFMHKKNCITQRSKPVISCPTGLYHTKKYQIIKKQMPSTAQIGSRVNSVKRAVTPSKNVLIGGCNLQEEAETYRKKHKELQLQIQKFNNQSKTKQYSQLKSKTNRMRTNRYQKRSSHSFASDNFMLKQSNKIDEKSQKLKIKEKNQLAQLQPWTVLVPQYQYY